MLKQIIDEIQEVNNNFQLTLINSLDIVDLLTITRDILSNANDKSIETIFKKIELIEKNIFESELLRICQNKSYRFVNNTFEFIFNEFETQELLYEIGNEISLFKNLIGLSAQGILKNTDVFFLKNNVFVTQETLSEGEKQLITVVGLKELITGEENLFLLDEPDTYLHPSWQNILIEALSDIETADKIIMTTHSAKLLGYVENNNIFILEDGRWRQEHNNTYGRDINWITEYVMGDKPRKIDIIEEIEDIYQLIEKEKYKEAQKAIENLTNKIGSNDNEILKLENNLFFHMD